MTDFLDHFDLKDKVAIVTGGGRGIGAATAKLLSECGATVVIASQSSGDATSTINAIESTGGKALELVCDISNPEQIKNLFVEFDKLFDKLDILVNNSGITGNINSILQSDTIDDQKVVDVNTRGTTLVSIEAAKRMIENKSGSIINISSFAGKESMHSRGIYSLSKAAVISMSVSLAKELAQFNIRSNCILPGFINTSMVEPLVNDPTRLSYALDRIPMRRIGLPEEVANVILFLASSASNYITGASIIVSGGR